MRRSILGSVGLLILATVETLLPFAPGAVRGQDEEAEVRQVLDSFARLSLTEDPKMRRQLLMQLFGGGSLTSRVLVEHLVELEKRDAAGLGEVLSELRAVSIPRLERVLTEGSDLAAQSAARCLGTIGGKEAAAILLQQLPTPNPERERAVLEALGSTRDPRALPRLVEASRPERPTSTRRVAALALGRIGRLESARVLLELLEDVDPSVRQEAARALSALGPAVIPVIEGSLDAASDRARALAVVAIGRLSGPRSLKLLIEKLEDPSWVVRLHAVEGLARRDEPAARSALKQRRAVETDRLVLARLRATADR